MRIAMPGSLEFQEFDRNRRGAAEDARMTPRARWRTASACYRLNRKESASRRSQ
nr:MAG TPA: hypothetical protein [Caudoviricetes sp.]